MHEMSVKRMLFLEMVEMATLYHQVGQHLVKSVVLCFVSARSPSIGTWLGAFALSQFVWKCIVGFFSAA